MWWIWGLGLWTVVAFALAFVIGPALRQAELREPAAAPSSPGASAGSTMTPAGAPRRRLPVPAFAVLLGTVGVALEAVGFGVRTAGVDGAVGQVFDMDHPLSLPRMFVAGLFAAAAVAGVFGALRLPERRGWWLAVAAVATSIAVVKAGGTVHTSALQAIGGYAHPVVALLLSAAVAAAVIAGLFWLSRTERRDRRRVLGSLALYAGAAVGLSAVSSLVGPGWATTATFVEETGEVLAGVTVLVAVLAGAAPWLVLPADWVRRRQADTQIVEVPGALPELRDPLAG